MTHTNAVASSSSTSSSSTQLAQYPPSTMTSTMQASKSLPPYTPSQPAPCYSDQPSTGEQSLQYTPRVGRAYNLPDSSYTKNFGRTSVVLFNQEQDVQIPSYRQNALVNGYINMPLCGLDRVTEVSVLIEGRLDLSIGGIHTDSIKTIHSATVLWKKPQHHSPHSATTCPETVQFAIPINRTFVDSNGQSVPVPPTFQTLDFIESGLFTRSSYRLRFTVKLSPKLGPRISLLEKVKHYFIPFEYRPRTRSHQPLGRENTSLAGIKALPDDWYQSTSTIELPATREDGSKFESVAANLLIPNPRVYALTDSIPFHFQLAGPVDSLRALVAPDTLDSDVFEAENTDSIPANTSSIYDTKDRSKSRSRSRSNSPSPKGRPPSLSPQHHLKKLQGQMSTSGSLRVFLLRQIRVEVKGKVRVQNAIIGEARLEAVPPPACVDESCGRWCMPVAGSGKQEFLSWVGKLAYGDLGIGGGGVGAGLSSSENGSTASAPGQGVARNLNTETDVGGFHVGTHLKVNDFVALSLGSQTPPWKDVVSSIGIRLVTDSWDLDYENGV